MANNKTYVIFDGDKDKWAYGYLKGWDENKNVNFDFNDAHETDSMTGRAHNEDYVKNNLRMRMSKSDAVIVLVGESTKTLYKYVKWEIDLAIELGLPIIVVNLNGKRQMDTDRCPAGLRGACAVHVSFRAKIIKKALDQWPAEWRGLDAKAKGAGWRYYNDSVYKDLGITD